MASREDMIPVPIRPIQENKDAPCNICGMGWPYHIETCAYMGTYKDLLAANARIEELKSALIQTEDALFDAEEQEEATRFERDVLDGECFELAHSIELLDEEIAEAGEIIKRKDRLIADLQADIDLLSKVASELGEQRDKFQTAFNTEVRVCNSRTQLLQRAEDALRLINSSVELPEFFDAADFWKVIAGQRREAAAAYWLWKGKQ